jgi:hypothetical protein
VQLQVPHNPPREKRKNEVGTNSEDTVESCQPNDNTGVDAFALLILIPEERYRVTLEEGDEEENAARKGSRKHGEIDSPSLDLFGCDSEQKIADGQFAGYHGKSVSEIAEPPAHHGRVNLIGFEVVVMSTSAKSDTNRR